MNLHEAARLMGVLTENAAQQSQTQPEVVPHPNFEHSLWTRALYKESAAFSIIASHARSISTFQAMNIMSLMTNGREIEKIVRPSKTLSKLAAEGYLVPDGSVASMFTQYEVVSENFDRLVEAATRRIKFQIATSIDPETVFPLANSSTGHTTYRNLIEMLDSSDPLTRGQIQESLQVSLGSVFEAAAALKRRKVLEENGSKFSLTEKGEILNRQLLIPMRAIVRAGLIEENQEVYQAIREVVQSEVSDVMGNFDQYMRKIFQAYPVPSRYHF